MSTVGNYRGPSIVKNGLVLYLDAATANSYNRYISPATLKDISGNVNNGALTNGPTYNSSNGGSIVLDGVDDSIIINNNSIFPSNTGTWSIWCYYSSTTNRMTLIQRHSSLSASGIIVYIGSGQNIGTQIYSSDTSQNKLSIGTSGNSLLRNVWNNVTLAFNNTDQVNLYINGTLSTSGTPTGTWSFNNQNITLGTSPDSFWTKYAGNISNAQIYNRVLTATEVLQNYNALKGRFGL